MKSTAFDVPALGFQQSASQSRGMGNLAARRAV